MRMYNHFVQGNAELISIASDDSIWNSDSDNDDEDNSDPAGEKDEVDGEEEITNWNRELDSFPIPRTYCTIWIQHRKWRETKL